MKLDFGKTVSILANVGVIASIVFLGVELRQNNELMEAEARAARNARLGEIPQIVSTDEGLADVLLRARSGATLTESEEFQVLSFNVLRLRGQEAFFREFQAGTVEAIPIENWRSNFYSDMWGPPQSETWSSARRYFQEDYVQWIEENIVNER